jgi:hypothetical protein
MNGFLQRLASNVLSPGRTIHPVIGSVFSDSTDRRSSEAFQEENSAPPRTWPESPVEPYHGEGASPHVGPEFPTSSTAALRPSGPDSEPRPPVSRLPTVPSIRRNYEAGELVEQKDVHLREKPEPGNSSRDLPRIIQTSAPSVKNIPVPTVISIPRKTEQERNPEPISPRKNPLRTRAQQGALEESEAVPNSRYQPFLAENLPRKGGATILPEISASLIRDPRKEEKGELSHRSGLSQREPDEIQIHIGRIEVVAVPPPVAPPASPRPRRGAPSLDEYLRRRNGRAV